MSPELRSIAVGRNLGVVNYLTPNEKVVYYEYYFIQLTIISRMPDDSVNSNIMLSIYFCNNKFY